MTELLGAIYKSASHLRFFLEGTTHKKGKKRGGTLACEIVEGESSNYCAEQHINLSPRCTGQAVLHLSVSYAI